MTKLKKLAELAAAGGLASLAWLSGCNSPGVQNAYGIIAPPLDVMK